MYTEYILMHTITKQLTGTEICYSEMNKRCPIVFCLFDIFKVRLNIVNGDKIFLLE